MGSSVISLLIFATLMLSALSFSTASDNSTKANAPISRAMLDCFGASPGRALSNATPSREFFNVSPDDCLRFCSAEHICNTVVYHLHFSTCQLYAGAEEGDGAQEVDAQGHDLYMKRECGQEEDEDDEDEEEVKKKKRAEEEEERKKKAEQKHEG